MLTGKLNCIRGSHACLCNGFSPAKGLDAQQTAFAIKKYKSHRRVGLATEVIQLMEAQKDLIKVPKQF